jgi:hypothetical protein
VFDTAFDRQPLGRQKRMLADGFNELSSNLSLPLLHRYESRLHRMYHRAPAGAGGRKTRLRTPGKGSGFPRNPSISS